MTGTKRRRSRDGITRDQRNQPIAAQERHYSGALIPTPTVTEFMTIKAVPVGSSPTGQPGTYHVDCILGVPGVSSILTHFRLEDILTSGDSLLSGEPSQVELVAEDGKFTHDVGMLTNDEGRISNLVMDVEESSFKGATESANDVTQPLLSRLAFEIDVPVQITAMVVREVATGATQISGTMVGGVRPMKDVTGPSNPDLRELYTTYREGLNSLSPIYQALSFWKAIEAAEIHSKRRHRKANKPSGPDLMLEVVSASAPELKVAPEWITHLFKPYVGKTFKEVQEATRGEIRVAAAHLIPGQESFVADRLSDVDKCREVVPVLRYLAHRLIEEEAKHY